MNRIQLDLFTSVSKQELTELPVYNIHLLEVI